ncbi:MAG: UvrD-helicase domain-containing protein [Acutalibacteraceae bacterium]
MNPTQMLAAEPGNFRNEVGARVYEEYQKLLKSANAVDFDDIIVLTVRLFEENPDVLEKYQNRFSYIMVDEYQDTNHAQYRLVSLLAEKYRNLCVVGDDDQSIYKFRGANIENIMNFEKQFPGAMVIRLEQNYRCTKKILDAANEVIGHNTQRKGKTLWTENDEGSAGAGIPGGGRKRRGHVHRQHHHGKCGKGREVLRPRHPLPYERPVQRH